MLFSLIPAYYYRIRTYFRELILLEIHSGKIFDPCIILASLTTKVLGSLIPSFFQLH